MEKKPIKSVTILLVTGLKAENLQKGKRKPSGRRRARTRRGGTAGKTSGGASFFLKFSSKEKPIRSNFRHSKVTSRGAE